jgi:ribonuclease-3
MLIYGIIQIADKVFAETLFKQDPDLLDVWVNYPPHPLQEQEPLGDRKWIPSFELLQVSTSVIPQSGKDEISTGGRRERFVAPAWVTGLSH